MTGECTAWSLTVCEPSLPCPVMWVSQLLEQPLCSQFDAATGSWTTRGLVVVGAYPDRDVILCAALSYGDFAITLDRRPLGAVGRVSKGPVAGYGVRLARRVVVCGGVCASERSLSST
jgi:hypothetical protein